MHSDSNEPIKRNGYIKVSRSTKTHWLWERTRKRTKLEAWLWLIMEARFTSFIYNNGSREIEVEVGQMLVTKIELSKIWKWERRTVDRYLDKLVKEDMIKISSTNTHTIITIVNYKLYNPQSDDPNYEHIIGRTDSRTINNSKSNGYEGDRASNDTTFAQRNTQRSAPSDVHDNILNDNYLQSTPRNETHNEVRHQKQPITNNNYNNYTNNTNTISGEKKFFEPASVENSPPAPPQIFSGKFTSMSILDIHDCLEVFLVSDITSRSRDLIRMKNEWTLDQVRQWGEAFNRFLSHKLVDVQSLAMWSEGFGRWLGKLYDKNEINPEKLDITSPIQQAKTNQQNNFNSYGNGKSNGSTDQSGSYKPTKIGGIDRDKAIEFHSRFSGNTTPGRDNPDGDGGTSGNAPAQ